MPNFVFFLAENKPTKSFPSFPSFTRRLFFLFFLLPFWLGRKIFFFLSEKRKWKTIWCLVSGRARWRGEWSFYGTIRMPMDHEAWSRIGFGLKARSPSRLRKGPFDAWGKKSVFKFWNVWATTTLVCLETRRAAYKRAIGHQQCFKFLKHKTKSKIPPFRQQPVYQWVSGLSKTRSIKLLSDFSER